MYVYLITYNCCVKVYPLLFYIFLLKCHYLIYQEKKEKKDRTEVERCTSVESTRNRQPSKEPILNSIFSHLLPAACCKDTSFVPISLVTSLKNMKDSRV